MIFNMVVRSLPSDVSFRLRSHRGDKAEVHLRYDGSKAFILRPGVRVEVTCYYNAVFDAAWVATFLYFKCSNSKGGAGVTEGSTNGILL